MNTSSTLTQATPLWTSDNGNWTAVAYPDPEYRIVAVVTNAKTGYETSAFLQYGYEFSGSGITGLPGYVRTGVEKALASEIAAMQLRELYKPGDTVKTLLRHVSSSGMYRSISVIKNDEDITWQVARCLGEEIDKHGGIGVGGCGMDMGFHLVYGLSRRLYTPFYCTGVEDHYEKDAKGNLVIGAKRKVVCPSNDHVNYRRSWWEWDEKTNESVRVENTEPDVYDTNRIHSDGGYALGHSWV